MNKPSLLVLVGFLIAFSVLGQRTAKIFQPHNLYNTELVLYSVHKLANNGNIVQVGSGILNLKTGHRKETPILLSSILGQFSNGNILASTDFNSGLAAQVLLDANLQLIPFPVPYSQLAVFQDFLIGKGLSANDLFMLPCSLNKDSLLHIRNYVVHPNQSYIALAKDQLWGIFDHQLRPTTNFEFDSVAARMNHDEKSPSQSLFEDGFLVRKNKSFQRLGFDGKVLIDSMPSPFYASLDNQLLISSLTFDGQSRKVWNKATKKLIYQCPQDRTIYYQDERLKVQDSITKLIGFMNVQGELVIPMQYTWNPGQFRYGLLVLDYGTKKEVFNKKGEKIVPPSSQFAYWVSDSIYLEVLQPSGKLRLVHGQTHSVLPYLFDQIENDYVNVAPVRIKLNELSGFLSHDYQKAITPFRYYAWSFFKNGYAFVETALEANIINVNGQVVYALQAGEFFSGLNGESKLNIRKYLEQPVVFPSLTPSAPGPNLYSYVNNAVSKTFHLYQNGILLNTVSYSTGNQAEVFGQVQGANLYSYINNSIGRVFLVYKNGAFLRQVPFHTTNQLEFFGQLIGDDLYSYDNSASLKRFAIYKNGVIWNTIPYASVFQETFGQISGNDFYSYVNLPAERRFVLYKNGTHWKSIPYHASSQTEFYGKVIGDDFYSYINKSSNRTMIIYKNGSLFKTVSYHASSQFEVFADLY